MAAISSIPEKTELHYPFFESETRDRGLLRRVAVAWEYPVHFTHDVFSWENLTLVQALMRRAPRGRHALVLVAGCTVAELHPTLVEDVGRYVEVHRERLALSGVAIVDPAAAGAAERIQAAVDQAGGAVVILAVGGRSLQELAGFVAASTRAPLVRLPTSLLAQAELAGAADTGTPPLAAICDLDWFQTLPRRASRAGVATAVECALRSDGEFFAWLREHAAKVAGAEQPAICELVRRCAHPHGERSYHPFVLDFARWAAPMLVCDEVGHGEALSLAIAIDVARSMVHGLIEPEQVESILTTMELLGLPTTHPILDRQSTLSSLVDRMQASKATSSTLLGDAGTLSVVDAIDEPGLGEAISFLVCRSSCRTLDA